MIHFESEYFQKIGFNNNQIKQYFNAARRDLEIAQKSDIPEVVFKFTYDALIKLGITLIAKYDYKVRSVQGHHIKILEKMSQILQNEDIAVIGNKMRHNRNVDFYDGGALITQKDSREYLEFVESMFKKARF